MSRKGEGQGRDAAGIPSRFNPTAKQLLGYEQVAKQIANIRLTVMDLKERKQSDV